MKIKDHLRAPVLPRRRRSIPHSFSWIDRQILHRKLLHALSSEAILLYFFLTLVAGPEGTSFWSYRAIARILKLTEDQVIDATAELVRCDLVAFRFPTFQVLSIPSLSKP